MNNTLVNYLLKSFLKTLLIVTLIVFCFGLILNLFEEIEFFKNIETGIFKPLIMTTLFVPSLVLKLLPFIIFVSSMWFMVKIRNNNDLLTLKIYGFSNIKIFLILAITSFLFGWIVLTIVSPITSSMVKYYEKAKSQHARDIDHLVTFNNNGLWIKEIIKNGNRIISAENIEGTIIKDTVIYEFDKNFKLKRKIISKKIDIQTNNWLLKDVVIFKSNGDVFDREILQKFEINSIYDYEKITSLFRNSDTISFIDLLINSKILINKGYSERFLSQTYHSMLSLPFFLFLMTSIAAILTMHTLKKADSYKFIILGLVVCVLIYYFKDLSLALGKTDRIPLILSIWSPVIALGFYTFIGVLQINEN